MNGLYLTLNGLNHSKPDNKNNYFGNIEIKALCPIKDKIFLQQHTQIKYNMISAIPSCINQPNNPNTTES